MISHSLTEEGRLIIGRKLSISILLQCVLFYDALRTHVQLIVVLHMRRKVIEEIFDRSRRQRQQQ